MHEGKVPGRYGSLGWPQSHHFLWCMCTRVTCYCPHARPKAKRLCYCLWMHKPPLVWTSNQRRGQLQTKVHPQVIFFPCTFFLVLLKKHIYQENIYNLKVFCSHGSNFKMIFLFLCYKQSSVWWRSDPVIQASRTNLLSLSCLSLQ